MRARALVLFSGTKSVERGLWASTRIAWDVTSLDVSPRFAPDLCVNILDWDYRAHAPPGHYAFIHASCPCEGFSIANKGRRDLELSNRLVLKTLELFLYFRPKAWTLENPLTGGLRQQDYMRGWPYSVVHYCQYGFPYVKKNIIFNNLGAHWTPRPLCDKRSCEFCDDTGKHHTTAQKGKTRGYPRDVDYTTAELWRIPHELCCEIRDAVDAAVMRNRNGLLRVSTETQAPGEGSTN